jgi:hypothetical protein
MLIDFVALDIIHRSMSFSELYILVSPELMLIESVLNLNPPQCRLHPFPQHATLNMQLQDQIVKVWKC